MRSIVLIAFVVLSGMVNGQQLRTKWSTNQCEIGEQVTLTLTLRKAPKKVDYRPYTAEINCEIRTDSSKLTSNGTLEIIGIFRDSTFTKKGERFWTGTYTITAWDTGVYVFPVIQLLAGDSVYSAQPADLTVGFEKKKIKDELDEVPVTVEVDYFRWLKDYWWIGLILLAIFAVWWIRRRNIRRRPPIVLSLKERTLLGIQALRKQAYWKKDRIDEHYIEFSFLLRSFLSARYDLNLMERTTYETISLLRARQLPEPTLERIRQLLQEADIVKFALGIPDEETIVLGLDYLEQLVIELSPLELLNE